MTNRSDYYAIRTTPFPLTGTFLSQSLQKLLKFEYIQLQIFENILMEELTEVGPDQVRCVASL